MVNIFNKVSYDIKVKNIHIPVDNTYKDFVFKSGDNKITQFDYENLMLSPFFKNAIESKKSNLSVKKEKAIKEKETKKVENDSKPISEDQDTDKK